MKLILLSSLLMFGTVNAQVWNFRTADQMIQEDIRQSQLTNDSDDGARMEGFASSEKKSVGLAAVYSLLLPGMGELYVGNYGTGKYFTVAEGGLWLTWTSFQLYGTWLQDDSRRFASQHAGVALANKDEQYFIDIGNFISRDSYNEQVSRDRDPQKIYDPRDPTYNWSWDSDQHKEEYRQFRVSSDNVFNNSRFVIAAIAVNHVVSAINAARLALSHNKSVNQAELLNIHARVINSFGQPDGIMLSVSKSF